MDEQKHIHVAFVYSPAIQN